MTTPLFLAVYNRQNFATTSLLLKKLNQKIDKRKSITAIEVKGMKRKLEVSKDGCPKKLEVLSLCVLSSSLGEDHFLHFSLYNKKVPQRATGLDNNPKKKSQLGVNF